MVAALKRFLTDESAEVAVSYSLVVVLIIFAAFLAIMELGALIPKTYNGVVNDMERGLDKVDMGNQP